MATALYGNIQPVNLYLPFVGLHTPSVDWRWWVANTSNLSKIAELNSARDKNLQLFLNQGGSAKFKLHLLDPKSEYIHKLSTSLLCERNGKYIWSGPIYNTEEISDRGTDALEVEALGWFNYFNKRIIHTGEEFKKMVELATEEGRITEYKNIGEETSIQLAYKSTQEGMIVSDLVNRANIDFSTSVTMGSVSETNSVNLTLQQFQNVGEQIMKLSNLEAGFDFEIDPFTRKFNIIRNAIRGGIVGKGVDRGKGVLFTYPGNCISVKRSAQSTMMRNRIEAIGQLYNVRRAQSISSMRENLALFEESSSLSDVVNEEILSAYASVQVATLERPFEIISFTPKSIGPDDRVVSSVPRPFVDYDLGDIVYTRIERGPRLRIGTLNPEPLRVYGMNISIDDGGKESISSVQTTYSDSST